MAKRTSRPQVRLGQGRVAFQAAVSEIRAEFDAGWSRRAVYNKFRDRLPIGFCQFCRYVEQYIQVQAFLLLRKKIAKKIDAGWPLIGIYHKYESRLPMSQRLFERYIREYITSPEGNPPRSSQTSRSRPSSKKSKPNEPKRRLGEIPTFNHEAFADESELY